MRLHLPQLSLCELQAVGFLGVLQMDFKCLHGRMTSHGLQSLLTDLSISLDPSGSAAWLASLPSRTALSVTLTTSLTKKVIQDTNEITHRFWQGPSAPIIPPYTAALQSTRPWAPSAQNPGAPSAQDPGAPSTQDPGAPSAQDPGHPQPRTPGTLSTGPWGTLSTGPWGTISTKQELARVCACSLPP